MGDTIYWVIFVNLDPFLKFIELIWNLNNYFGLYIFLDIYICVILIFAWTHPAILLVEYELMTHGTCCKFIWVYILFFTFILFYFY